MNATLAIAAALMGLGGLIAFLNWWSIYWSHRTKKFHSVIPLFGALLLGAGMFLLPATRRYCWTAVILDYGTLAFLFAVPRLVQELWSTGRFNLVSEYVARAARTTARLRLFRRGVFTTRVEVRRTAGECGVISIGNIGRWQREGNRLTLHTQWESAVFEVIRDVPTVALRQLNGFPSWKDTGDHSLAAVEFVQIR